ncbi:FG-GAP-like repeat-containing protein [Streptomyces sp. ISL-86]|uniref:FG-GAP-like repeat-containing protein n=1 Tax=Streptomyces sp. ISL-86 TaxID=2819187 RepID=UPI001BE89797|nr:FG-GAP-like repeat-containing protein [Streptomyces sp. ISL-86]MBT2458511.1 VCBS repeat-containing protein [Streptomyces sp. ISL-86]
MRIRRWLPAATLTAAVAITTPTPLASADTVPAANADAPYTVEDGAYPFRSDVLAATGADLIAGDGNIIQTSCTGSYQITVWARNLLTNETRICFKAANTGYLSVNIPRAYRIETNDRDLKANISIAGETSTLTVPKDTSKGFGEADPANPQQAVLLEMRITGSATAAPAPSGDITYAFTGKLTIGDNKRFCTATLIDPRWVLAAKSCFADNPAENNTVTAGAPKEKTTLTVGRADLATTGGHTTDIAELVPRADRDVVMARLAKPALNISPVTVSDTAPTSGEELTVAAFGRTSTVWAPSKIHSAAFTVGTIGATGFDLAAKATSDTSVCKGDAGAPALRTENGKPALVALGSRSWQDHCLDANATKAGAYDTRTDDIRGWIGTHILRRLAVSQTASADFTSDGVADLLVKDTAAGDLLLSAGNKGGSFSVPRKVTGGWEFTETTAGDFTGDGKADLIARNAANVLYLWAGDGTGSFSAPKQVTGGWDFTQTTAGDFTGDGKPDLIARNAANVLYLWAGDGTGSFSAPKQVTGGWDFTQTTAGDFTGDGKADLIARTAANLLYLWAGDGAGKFSAPKLLTSGWDFTQTTAGDFTGDGKADLTARNANGDLLLWIGQGSGNFNRVTPGS